MKRLITFILILFCFVSFSQSTSVFDANYFNKNDATPPIKVGKGFHINDVYRQTRHCFTPESSNQDKLTKSQSGTTTKINLYYTKDEEEYNYLKHQGASGKISFLNLFSLGGDKLKEYSVKDESVVERITFVAKVDFGVYSFDYEPKLNQEAKDLIAQSKFEDFIQMYGTHYISGVRKENSIWITLTKKSSTHTTTTEESFSVGADSKMPLKPKIGFEIGDGTETENVLKNNEFSISVEINGPSIKNELEKNIGAILDNSSVQNKISAIRATINEAAGELSNANQSLISQYYYTPFTLLGVKGINWDEKKQSELVKINENAVHLFSTKSILDEYAAPSGKDELMSEFNTDIPEYKNKALYKAKLAQKYDEVMPIVKMYKIEADTKLGLLEKRYKSCSDVFCNQETECCLNSALFDEIAILCNKCDKELEKISDVYLEALEDYEKAASIPECEEKKKGYIIIENLSTNPYELYQGDKYLTTISGGESLEYFVNIGTYNFKAVQKSGFLMYATVNNRMVKVSQSCAKYKVKIGFEDQ